MNALKEFYFENGNSYLKGKLKTFTQQNSVGISLHGSFTQLGVSFTQVM